MLRFIPVVFLSVTLYQNAHGLFTSSPSDVTPNKSKDATLTCKPIGVEGAILAIHIKKKDELPVEAEGDVKEDGGEEENEEEDVEEKGKEDENDSDSYLKRYKREYQEDRRRRRSYTEDSVDDDFVRATMTSGSRIDVVPDVARFEVEGNIDTDPYLSVKILDPGVSDLGLYECQITFFDSSGSIQISSETTTINEALALSLESLEERVSKLEGQLPLILAIGNEVQTTVQEVQANARMLQEDIAALKKENKQLVETIADLSSELRSLGAKFTAMTGQRTSHDYDSGYGSGDSRDYKSYSDESDYKGGGLGSDELFKVNARMDELENTRIHVLEQQVDEIKDRQMDAEDRMHDMEVTVNETMDRRIRDLEKLDWKGISESLEEIEVKTIPVMMTNFSDIDSQLGRLRQAVSMVLTPQDMLKLMQSHPQDGSLDLPTGTTRRIGTDEAKALESGEADKEDEETTTTSVATTTTEVETLASTTAEATTTTTIPTTEITTTTTTTTTTTPTTTTAKQTGFHIICHVCGNNNTLEACTTTTSKNDEVCPDEQPSCMTDVYQDGRFREIYRRCATMDECMSSVKKSDSRCATDPFILTPAMECHFCCSSNNCNDYIRPTKDLYTG